MSMKFEKGQTYNVVKKLGVVMKASGNLQISQHTGKDGPDIEVSEALTFDGREGGKLWFIRADGTKVIGHKTHFDPADAYNTLQKEPKTPKVAKPAALKENVAVKQAELDATAKLLEDLVNAESADQIVEADPMIDEARSEAASMLDS